MLAIPVEVTREIHDGRKGSQSLFIQGDARESMAALLPEYERKIKLIYMDPPFMTGARYNMRLRVGTAGWKQSTANLTLPSYNDYRDRDAFLAMMREVLALCRQLLSEDGMIFVHLDYRANAHVRLLMDELFGESHFMNEIIWGYNSGGRSRLHFSRKHDTILFYSNGDKPDFNIDAVMAENAR